MCHIPQQMHTIRYKTYTSVRELLHVSVSMCRPQEITDTSSIGTNTSILIVQCYLVRSSNTKVDVLVLTLL